MKVQSVYDSIADFFASMNPQKILELKPTPENQLRLEKLIEKEKDHDLTKEEKDELDHYIVLERLLSLAKTHAAVKLS